MCLQPCWGLLLLSVLNLNLVSFGLLQKLLPHFQRYMNVFLLLFLLFGYFCYFYYFFYFPLIPKRKE